MSLQFGVSREDCIHDDRPQKGCRRIGSAATQQSAALRPEGEARELVHQVIDME